MPTDPSILMELNAQGINIIEPERQIAEKIRDNEHLRQFIKALKIKDRKLGYEKLKPFLKFKAKPLWWILS